MLQAVETKWDGRWETEEKEQGAVEEKRARGVHPHCDGKSPQAIERKGVEVRPLRKIVRKPLIAKGLNDGNDGAKRRRSATWGLDRCWSLANTGEDSMPVRIG